MMKIGISEAEARSKWCPFSQTGAYADFRSGGGMVATNRDPRPDVQNSCNCLGSECMAWRWLQTGVAGAMKEDGAPGDLEESSDSHGYCGLAGHPTPAFFVNTQRL